MASQVAACKSTVSGKPSVRIRQIFLLLGQDVVIGAEEPANVGESILFRRHGAAIALGENLLSNLSRRFRRVTRFTQLDEVGVFRETARVDVKRNPMFLAYLFHFANIVRWRPVGRRRSCW